CVIIASPLIAWFQVSQTSRGILAGVTIALVIILAEIVIEKIPLDKLIVGAFGTILGFILAQTLSYAAYLVLTSVWFDRFHRYSVLFTVGLAYFGMVVAVQKLQEVDL